MFYAFSFPAGVYIGTLNLIASIPDPSILNHFEGQPDRKDWKFLAILKVLHEQTYTLTFKALSQ